MYCASCEVRTEFIYVMYKKVARLCVLVVRVPWLHDRDVLCFLWGLDWIYISYVKERRPPLCSWLQIQRSGIDYRRHQNLWSVVGLERGPLCLLSSTDELLERKRSGSCLENREYDLRDPSRWPCDSLYPQKLALTSTSGGRSVGIVRPRTQATEFSPLVLDPMMTD
jgi:hypothetical protein